MSGLLTQIFIHLIAILGLAIGILYLFFKKQYRYWKVRNIPYVKPKFPLGNLGDAAKKSISEVFLDLYAKTKHERFYGIFQLHKPCLFINDPDLIKSVMVGDFMSFHDHGIYSNEEDPLSVNLVASEGTVWRNQRVKLTPVFTSGKMKNMFPILVECGKKFVEVLKTPAKNGEAFEAKEWTARYTTDVIATCAFGIEVNSLENPNAEFRRIGRKIFEPGWLMIIRNMTTLFIPDLARLLRLSQFPGEVSEFFLRVFREMIDYREKNNVKRNDILQLLIQLQKKGYIDDVDTKGNGKGKSETPFTFEQAAAQAFIFFLGGFETSSSTMQFTLYELALNQDMQSKVREEIKRVIAKHNGEITYEGTLEMTYLGQIIDETLRKYPAGSLLNRVCTKPYKIPDTDIVLEKGTMVLIPVYGLHMDERYYPNPEKFDPNRFSDEEKAKRHHYTYLPFGEGPRVCIGQRFAQMQTRVALISLLLNYKFDISPLTPVPMEFDKKGFILSPKGGMHLKISALE